jgi:hypothetical protein
VPSILGIVASGFLEVASGITFASKSVTTGTSDSPWSITQASFSNPILAGDYLVLFERYTIDYKSGNYPTAVPDGWVRQQVNGSAIGEGSTTTIMRLCTRVASASESTYTSPSGLSYADSWTAGVFVLRSAYKHDASSTAVFVLTTSATSTAVAAAGNADAILYFMSDGNSATTTLTAPSGMTEMHRETGARNVYAGFQVASGAASYTKTGTLSSAESGLVAAMAINNTVATVPDAPTSVKHAHFTSGIVLPSFTAGSTNGGDLVEYQYKLDSGAWTSITPAMYSSYGYSWLDARFGITGLTNRQVYSLQLRGVNGAGNGTASTAVDVSPGAYVRSYADSRVTGGTSITINKPSGTVDGDIMVMFFATNGTGTITPPSGWTNRASLSNGNRKYHVYTRTAASEGSTYTFSFTTTTYTSAIIYSVANATAYDSIQTATATAASTINVPTITPTGNGSLWIGGFYTAASGTPYPELHADFFDPNFATSFSNERHRSGYISLANQNATGTRTTTGSNFGTGWATSVIIK